MKKFVFSLATVHRYKTQVLSTLMTELAALQRHIAALEAKRRELETVFVNTNKRLTDEMRDGLHSADIAVYKLYLSDVDLHIVQLNAQLRIFEDLLDQKRMEILAVNTDLAGMEKLREKQLAEYAAQEAKEMQIFIEEFVGNAQSRK